MSDDDKVRLFKQLKAYYAQLFAKSLDCLEAAHRLGVRRDDDGNYWVEQPDGSVSVLFGR